MDSFGKTLGVKSETGPQICEKTTRKLDIEICLEQGIRQQQIQI